MVVSEAMDIPMTSAAFTPMKTVPQPITESLSEPLLPETKPKLRWKCHSCHIVFDNDDLVDGKKCPDCGEVHLEKMCELDHTNCTHEHVAGLKECPKCGQPVCPICNCHDVFQVSRVTGYLANVSGFNEGKRQELRDRHRYSITGQNH